MMFRHTGWCHYPNIQLKDRWWCPLYIAFVASSLHKSGTKKKHCLTFRYPFDITRMILFAASSWDWYQIGFPISSISRRQRASILTLNACFFKRAARLSTLCVAFSVSGKYEIYTQPERSKLKCKNLLKVVESWILHKWNEFIWHAKTKQTERIRNFIC